MKIMLTIFFRCITDPAYEDVNNAHERALVFMHKVSLILKNMLDEIQGPKNLLLPLNSCSRGVVLSVVLSVKVLLEKA